MDWSSLIGLLIALAGIIGGLLLEGGRFSSLLQPAAFLIVVLGTVGAVLLQSGRVNFMRGLRMSRWLISPPASQYLQLAKDVTSWSYASRREGLLSLERVVSSVKDPLLAKGLHLIVDGIDPHRIREMLETDISAYETRERLAVRVWESAGGYAPTVGILGAVLGLIQVMENLSDPARLGSGIAVAFVATIYGVGLANLVFLPIAGRLKAIVSREVAQYEVLVDALSMVATGENPRMVEERLAVYVTPKA